MTDVTFDWIENFYSDDYIVALDDFQYFEMARNRCLEHKALDTLEAQKVTETRSRFKESFKTIFEKKVDEFFTYKNDDDDKRRLAFKNVFNYIIIFLEENSMITPSHLWGSDIEFSFLDVSKFYQLYYSNELQATILKALGFNQESSTEAFLDWHIHQAQMHDGESDFTNLYMIYLSTLVEILDTLKSLIMPKFSLRVLDFSKNPLFPKYKIIPNTFVLSDMQDQFLSEDQLQRIETLFASEEYQLCEVIGFPYNLLNTVGFHPKFETLKKWIVVYFHDHFECDKILSSKAFIKHRELLDLYLDKIILEKNLSV